MLGRAGLGKTVQALAVAAHFREAWPVLVVCPSSVRFVWEDQALTWLQEFLHKDDIVVVTSGRRQGVDAESATQILVISLLLTSLPKCTRPLLVSLPSNLPFRKCTPAKLLRRGSFTQF